ncbi:MAG: adenylate/guanylate cyclase domain-containing protein [Chloroflexi bacterium]|nr:adenylate/guanylate cyclase domain-containing protein [Chloroflexota bacterium]
MSVSRTTQTVRTTPGWMREYHYRWVWQMQSAPDVLWQYAANTDRFNRDAHVPDITILPGVSELPNHQQRLQMYRFRLGPLKLVPIEWMENPFEWIKPHQFGVLRTYSRGPVAYMRTFTELRARPEGGTELVYEVWAAPRNRLGALAIPFQIGLLSKRDFRRAFMHYDRLAQEKRPLEAELPHTRPALAPGGRTRLTTGERALEARDIDRDLIARLIALIERGDDLSLARMRPYALADAWAVPRRAVLELFLYAARAGLLDSRWELLCPLCRGAKAVARELGEIPQHVHCDVCHIDYQVNFDQSVELVFTPNSTIRQIDNAAHCIGGPQVTPHVLAQRVLRPGARQDIPCPWEIGRYRVRTSELPGSQFLRVASQGDREARFAASPDGWQYGEVVLRPGGTLHLENATEQDQLFMLERLAWNDQAATAAEVTTLQVFRDLYSREVLRNDVQIGISGLTLMFTDLGSSTALYREIGDASAFGIVMNHFDVLRSVIGKAGGSVIKTNGDAVMAVFRRPIQAVSAAVEAQRLLAHPPEGVMPLSLKVGLHSGNCIAVNLNERLDYFGSVVNMAARLESLSKGTDIVMSHDVYSDNEVVDYFTHHADLGKSSFQSTLKGFGDEPFELWRVTTTVH